MRMPVAIPLGLLLAWGVTSCTSATRDLVPPLAGATPELGLHQASPPSQVATTPPSTCPPAAGPGSNAPAISILSVTFVVNDAEVTLSEGDALPAPPGSEVRVKEVEICVGSFSGDGGQACVDFAPVGELGQEITPEHAGTHLVPLNAGVITVAGPDRTWTIHDSWIGISAVVNHWPGVQTGDLGCGNGGCERDDAMTFPFR